MRRHQNVAALLLTVLLLSGCGDRTSRPLRETSLLIAALGNFSSPGIADEMSQAIEIAIGEYNRMEDSAYRLSLVKVDTKGTPEGVSEAANSLVTTDLLVGVIGPFEASEALAAGSVLNDAAIPFLVPNVVDIALPQSGWTSFRRLVANLRQEGVQLGRSAATTAGENGIAVLFDSTQEGAVVAEGAKSAIEELQKSAAKFEKVSDVGAMADAIVREQVGVVIFGGSAEMAGQLVGALGEKEFTGDIIASHQAREPRFQEVAAGHAEGTISACVCSDGAGSYARAFVAHYRERFNAAPSPFAIEAYDGAWMLLEAIQEVEPRPREITDFFRKSRDFLGDAKRYRFDDNGELIEPSIWLKEFKRGKWAGASRPGDSARLSE